MTEDNILRFLDYYKDVNPSWLLTGVGPMLKSTEDVPHSVVCEKQEDYNKAIRDNSGIPLIPTSAFAGFAAGEQVVLEYECERYVVPVFRDAEFLIPVKGSSMSPKYNSGDIVACKKLPLNDLFFQWNKVYVLDTAQGVLIKRIKKGSDNDHILIVSDNADYDPFELHKNQLTSIAIVIGVIRLE